MSERIYLVNPVGLDVWNYTEEFDSREAAIEWGRKEFAGHYKEFETGIKEAACVADFVDGEGMIERIAEIAYDNCGECTEDYLTDVKKEDINALEKMVADFLEQRGYGPTFYRVMDVQTHDVNA